MFDLTYARSRARYDRRRRLIRRLVALGAFLGISAGAAYLALRGGPSPLPPPNGTPSVVAPNVVAPNVVAPNVVAPNVIAPNVVAPNAVAPIAVAPNAVAPNVVAPNVVAPNAVAPIAVAPNAVAPNVIAPNVVAPNAVAPNVVAPNVIAPNVIAPNVVAPNVVAPHVVAPNAVAPNAVAPNVAAPPPPVAALKVRPLEAVDADMIPHPPRADRLVSAVRLPRELAAVEASQPKVAPFDLRAARRRGDVMVVPTTDGEATLTLLPRVQEPIAQMLAKYEVPNGAFAAVEPATGRVLALASYSRAHPDGRSFALRGIAPAASIFKLVTAAALLESSGLDPERKICFRGGKRRLYERHLRDSARDARCVDLPHAVAFSLNVPIAKLAVKNLAPDSLLATADAFGFNRVLPFDLPVQPSYARIPNDRLGFGRAAAGFGDVRMSALHGALLAAAFANGGQLMRPYVVEEARAPDGRVLRKGTPEILGVAASPHVARRVARMMALTTRTGTGRRHLARRGRRYLGDIEVPGKTGSLFVYDPFMDYSWFVGFAPADKPQIAFAAVVGNTPLWHIKSGFLAIEGLRKFFQRERGQHKPPRAIGRRARRRGRGRG